VTSINFYVALFVFGLYILTSAGHRWHVECFRCSTCGNQLDCDTNLLVLGNGSLICNNCSYHCNICKKKIEDLAILTGEQAFCSNCFVCRNCKKKISDLKYARTSQGIFCMSCHETLLARKRRNAAKKAAAAAATMTGGGASNSSSTSSIAKLDASTRPNRSSIVTFKDKSLPSIPPAAHEPPPPPLPFYRTHSTRSANSLSSEKARWEKGLSTSSSIPSLREVAKEQGQNHHDNNTSHKEHHHHQRSDTSSTMNMSNFIDDIVGSNSDDDSASFVPIKLDTTSLPSDDESKRKSIRKSQFITKSSTIESLPLIFDSDEKLEEKPPDDNKDSIPSSKTNGSKSPVVGSPRTEQRHPSGTRNAIYLNSEIDLSSTWSLDDTDDTSIARNSLDSMASTATPGLSANRISRRIPIKLELDDRRSSTLIPERSALRSTSPSLASPRMRRIPLSPVSPALVVPTTLQLEGVDSGSAIDNTPDTTRTNLPTIKYMSEDQPTISHRRSISDTKHVRPSGLAAPADIVSASPLISTTESLTRELVESKKRIAELERLLKERNERTNNVQTLESDILERRRTIAGLEAQGVVARKELELLDSKKDGPVDTSKLIDEFSSQLASVKSSLMAEIAELVVERDKLVAENSKLINVRDNAIEESSLLNLKNSQLADMNNELTQQLIDKFGPYALLKPDSKTKRSKDSHSPGRTARIDNNSPSTSSKEGTYNSHGEQPMVTILDATSVVDTRKDRQNARRFWKRPGAAVAKGLTKVFASDFEAGPEFYDANVSGDTSTLGANSKHHASKQSRNGWFKYNEANGGAIGTAVAASVTLGQSQMSGVTSPPAKVVGTALSPSSSTSAKEPTLMGASIESRTSLEGVRIPKIVTRCIEEVEKRGMILEGIYRKSGAKSQVISIEEAFERSLDGDFDEVLSGDISGVTSALKQYLRYLPTPLITFDVYEDFIRSCSDPNVTTSIDNMRKVVDALPAPHKECLEFLVRHLYKVTGLSSVNLMTSRNLAVVFAPTLARDRTGEREMVDMQARNDSTQLLIDHCEAIFSGF
jgi:hypothetical protein